MHHRNFCSALLALVALAALPGAETSARNLAPTGFFRAYWFERGIEHGNPSFNSRFRVNAPETTLHPQFGKRSESRGNGMMLIRADEDLFKVTAAELYLELWGGHPGTANKRVTVNGRTTYDLPRNGTEEKHCTHLYPTIALERTDLVNGYNALQFACDRGTTFWGHFIVDNAALRFFLAGDHPDLAKLDLTGFEARVRAEPGDGESIRLAVDVSPASHAERIAAVDFVAHHDGYDENGDGRTADWHGFTKKRSPVAIAGSAARQPFAVEWDVSMLRAQEDVAVRAVVHFRGDDLVMYRTPITTGLKIPERTDRRVRMYAAKDLPRPFWSRANRLNRCAIEIDADPESIERAELHVVLWDGGRGTIDHPFKLNGQPLAVAGEGRHDVLYRRLALDPKILRRGTNQVELLSDTEHHGIEVLRPGPAIVVRRRVGAD